MLHWWARYCMQNTTRPTAVINALKCSRSRPAIGDLLADQSEREQFEARLNSDRDVYVWLETYRLLKDKLGAEREGRWRRELEKNVAELASDVAARKDFPGYQSPYIGTSPNHYALWASTVYLAGRVFGQREWETLGASVMHRFAEEEQSPDGYWGEHERSLPTPGYGYNTYASVALYAEWSRDPAAMKALRAAWIFTSSSPTRTERRSRCWTIATATRWSRDGENLGLRRGRIPTRLRAETMNRPRRVTLDSHGFPMAGAMPNF